MNNNTEAAHLLIKHKADLEASDKDSKTPFDIARTSPTNNEEVICLLSYYLKKKSWTNAEDLFNTEMKHLFIQSY